jgi:hypothetical protein
MESTLRSSLFAVVGVFSWLAGCSAGNGEDGSPPMGAQMQIREHCEKTECDLRMEKDSYACEKCLNACFSASYSCSSSACSASCAASKPCREWENKCAISGYEVILPNNPSLEIAAACRRWVAHVEECGFQANQTASTCDLFASVEKPEMAAVYECVAAISCDDLTNAQAFAPCQPPPSTFGDELCSKISAVCGFSDWCGSSRDELNAAGAYLRDDVKAAALWCTKQGCDGGRECIWAWRDVVFGSTP